MVVDLYWIGEDRVGRLAIVSRPRGGDWLDDDLAAFRTAGIDVLVSLLTPLEMTELELTNEPAAAEAAGLEFVSFPIVDQGVPASIGATRQLLGRLLQDRARDRTIAIHCRMSIGRSSVLAAVLLIAGGLPVGDAWQQLERARGCLLPDTELQRTWVESLAWKQLLQAS